MGAVKKAASPDSVGTHGPLNEPVSFVSTPSCFYLPLRRPNSPATGASTELSPGCRTCPERSRMDANVINQAGEKTACIKGLAGTNVLVRQEKRAASVILTALQFGDTNCTLCPVFSRRCCRLSQPAWFITPLLVVHCCFSNPSSTSRNHRPAS